MVIICMSDIYPFFERIQGLIQNSVLLLQQISFNFPEVFLDFNAITFDILGPICYFCAVKSLCFELCFISSLNMRAFKN